MVIPYLIGPNHHHHHHEKSCITQITVSEMNICYERIDFIYNVTDIIFDCFTAVILFIIAVATKNQ